MNRGRSGFPARSLARRRALSRGRSCRWLPVLPVLVTLAGACADLPSVSAGVCGNGVVDPNEDCDTFASIEGTSCTGPGIPGACHYDCRPGLGGLRAACPGGWGCDAQGICHPPTGEYKPLPDIAVGGAFSLLSGDFDGDGRADLVSSEPVDLRGRTKFGFRYFDENGALAESRLFPKEVGSPVVTDLDGDGRDDLTFSNFAVGLLLGHSDRSLVPETFSSYHFPDASVRLWIVNDNPIEDISAVVAATTIEGQEGLFVPDRLTGILRLRARLPGPTADLLSNPVGGDIIVDPLTSPCQDLVVAARGGTSLSIIEGCERTSADAPITWRDPFVVTEVALDPPAPIDAAPQLLDIDGDGHLDVILGAGGRAYVAYGDGHQLAAAVPYSVPLVNPDFLPGAFPMPLAAGDFTGDGAVDFVFPNFLLESLAPTPGSPPVYFPDNRNDGSPWTVARVADLNGDGKADVVAASNLRLGIDFFNGTGTPRLHGFDIPTERPVPFLAIGDMDGDLINDVSFVESMATDDKRDAVMIAFGSAAGPPEMPVPVARVSEIADMSCLSEFGVGNLIVSSTETTGTAKSGVLAILDGSGDRLPFAPYQLVSVTADRSVNQAAALAVQIGSYLMPGRKDLLALTSDGDPNNHDFHFWLLPRFGARQNTAVPLGGRLAMNLQPGSVVGFFINVNLVAAAGDLDGDGLDESLWAMPANDGAACGILVVGLRGGAADLTVPGATPPSLDMRPAVVIDEPCPNPQLMVVDVDGDRRPEVVLLTGKTGAAARNLIVLWNDGQGGIDAGHAEILNRLADSPQQFTVRPAVGQRPFALAYVTPEMVLMREAMAGAKGFYDVLDVAHVTNGSGLAAADFNGDGVMDLAVASSGILRVLRAELRVP